MTYYLYYKGKLKEVFGNRIALNLYIQKELENSKIKSKDFEVKNEN